MRFFRVITLVFILVATPSLAAWYLDRDNSMVPAEPEIGEAMANQLGLNTNTQAIQVCSGVYLATAHGTFYDPFHRDVGIASLADRPPHTRIVPYPMIRENMMSVIGQEYFLSPRLDDSSLWEGAESAKFDYAFVRIDDPLRPDSFIRPLEISPETMLERHDEIEIFMYRGFPHYEKLPSGLYDFGNNTPDSGSKITDRRQIADLHQIPQKVHEACAISTVRSSYLKSAGLVAHNCPVEQGASGSPYISHIDGTPYLVGITTMGSANYISSSGYEGGSTLLASSHFCADYERACGQPCVQLEDILE